MARTRTRTAAPMSFGSRMRLVLGRSVLGGDNLDGGAHELPAATMDAISPVLGCNFGGAISPVLQAARSCRCWDITVNEEGVEDTETLLGMVVHSEDEAYKLYNDYAIRIGFSVRKEKIRYAKNVVRQQDYVCSKEGFPRDSDNLDDKKFKNLQTRTGCEASIRFTVTNGEWKVIHFNPTHNHELAKLEERPFLRSNRKITDAQLGVIKTFKEAGHRLCLWHISKDVAENLPRHYGIPEFKSRFNKILYNCETESEFESSWDALLSDYNLVGNKWLNTLYENRERWCSVFSHNIFSARIKASSRSESVNNVFQHMACKIMRLTKFVYEYEKASKNMRVEELEEDFRCKQGTSSQIVQNCGLLEHALSVYTRTFFKRIELEIASTLGVTHQDVYSDGVPFTYEVIEGGGRRVRVVQFNSSNNTVPCSCKMFETLELLCRHALRILIVKNVTELPVQYILKRWTNDAKKDSVLCDLVKPASANDELSVTSRSNELMHSVNEILTKSAATTRHTEMCKRKDDRIS
ncbi:protein FAR1-RELATED SEQUENCE 5-like [Castanea sativa]|uniref:protein FAR1-RELATED SEQUENCE 5-like n=1 Tax=Castanea sativa TaxID=21020 RepID=UPI003F64B503